MQAAQMMGVNGGWPLNILMSYDKRPFYATTYLPKHSRFGRIGLIELVQQVGNMWQTDRARVLTPAGQLAEAMASMQATADAAAISVGERAAVPADFDAQVFSGLNASFDAQHGGFGQAPKFPSPHKLLFLLRYWHKTGDKQALNMVETTLTTMRAGGIFDQLGYGFHRYSTDGEWLLPHFEKMLSDQAMLLMAYAEAYQATGKPEFATTAREIADYVQRVMRAPQGGFYSAEDADSDGEEGLFYMWRLDELNALLGKDDAAFTANVFVMIEAGNIRDEATGKQTGANVLHLVHPPVTDKDKARLETIRKKMFAAREKRVHPFRDDKILTDWNGLMIAALSIAARALDEPEYAQSAATASDFMLKNMRGKSRLLHRYRAGKAGIKAHLDDYAFLVWGLLELYETGLNPVYLQAASDLNKQMLAHFSSPSGAFYFTADDSEALPSRLTDAYDGALPSGNSVAMMNLVRLSRMTGNTTLEEQAANVAAAFATDMPRAPSAFIWMAAANMRATTPGFEIVLAGDRHSPQAETMLHALHTRFLPNHVLLWSDEAIHKLAPYTQGQQAIAGQVTAYVCENFQCNLPVTDAEKMLELLHASASNAD